MTDKLLIILAAFVTFYVGHLSGYRLCKYRVKNRLLTWTRSYSRIDRQVLPIDSSEVQTAVLRIASEL